MARHAASFGRWLWLCLAALFVFAVVVGAVMVAREPTAQNGFRWVMAMLFLGAPVGYLYGGRRPR